MTPAGPTRHAVMALQTPGHLRHPQRQREGHAGCHAQAGSPPAAPPASRKSVAFTGLRTRDEIIYLRRKSQSKKDLLAQTPAREQTPRSSQGPVGGCPVSVTLMAQL